MEEFIKVLFQLGDNKVKSIVELDVPYIIIQRMTWKKLIISLTESRYCLTIKGEHLFTDINNLLIENLNLNS